ncbi:13251_t:CDS:2, partial [Funneliformis caledonium]
TETVPPSTSLISLEESSDSKTVEILQDQQENKEARSHKKKEVENIVQDVFDFTVDKSDKNHMTNFSLTAQDPWEKIFRETFEKDGIEKERENKASSNVVTPAKG